MKDPVEVMVRLHMRGARGILISDCRVPADGGPAKPAVLALSLGDVILGRCVGRCAYITIPRALAVRKFLIARGKG